MNRREFLKTAGGGLVATSALLSACNNKKQQENTPIDSKEPIAEEMTYRITPNTNDKVSLLGYGTQEKNGQKHTDHNLRLEKKRI